MLIYFIDFHYLAYHLEHFFFFSRMSLRLNPYGLEQKEIVFDHVME